MFISAHLRAPILHGANECAPKTCRCGHKLDKPKHDYPWIDQKLTEALGFSWYDTQAPIQNQCWHISCVCGVTYIWGWHEQSNGCWRIRSNLPLMDSQEVVVIA